MRSRLFEPREREVAAANVAYERHDRIVAPHQVELGLERVAKKELHDHLARPQLSGKPAGRPLVLVARRPGRQLLAHPFGQLDVQAVSGRIVDARWIPGRFSVLRSASPVPRRAAAASR